MKRENRDETGQKCIQLFLQCIQCKMCSIQQIIEHSLYPTMQRSQIDCSIYSVNMSEEEKGKSVAKAI